MRYAMSVKLVVDVVNSEHFTPDEIEDTLRRDFEREIRDNGTPSTLVVSRTSGVSDYGLRFVRRSWGIETQHPDDPVEVAS